MYVGSEQTGKRFYVYLLRYPQNYYAEDKADLGLVVFYVGKGCKGDYRDRIDEHEIEARVGAHNRKSQVIRDIWSRGLEVHKEKVYYTDIEKEALLEEKILIQKYQSPYLTNVRNNQAEIARIQKELAADVERWKAKSRQATSIRKMATLNDLITEAGLRKKELADKSGVDVATIIRIGGGKSTTRVTVVKLVRILEEYLRRDIDIDSIEGLHITR